MFKKILCCLLIVCVNICLSSSANAWTRLTDTSLKKKWFGGPNGTLDLPGLDAFRCASDDNVNLACFFDCSGPSQRHGLFIGMQYAAHGVRFYTANVYGNRDRKSQDAWTAYKAVSGIKVNGVDVGSNYDAFWLCESGWTGEGCNTKLTEDSGVDTRTLDLSYFTGAVYKDYNWEPTMVLLDSAYYKCDGCNDKVNPWYWSGGGGMYNKCGMTNKQEHDIVLAIKSFDANGHGATVVPIGVRVFCATGKTGSDCKIITNIWPQEYEQHLCLNGYSSVDGKCVPVAEVPPTDCAGWSADLFSGDDYIRTLVADKDALNGNCYQYRCSSGKGFQGDPLSGGDAGRKCVECAESAIQCVSSADGQCIVATDGQVCSGGKLSNATASTGESLVECISEISNLEQFKQCVLSKK